MTVNELLIQVDRNSADPINSNAGSPQSASELLRWSLKRLLEDFDYEENISSNTAVAARAIAVVIHTLEKEKPH